MSFQNLLTSGPKDHDGYIFSAPKEFTLNSASLIYALQDPETRKQLDNIIAFLRSGSGVSMPMSLAKATVFQSWITFADSYKEIQTSMAHAAPTDDQHSAWSITLKPIDTDPMLQMVKIELFKKWIDTMYTQLAKETFNKPKEAYSTVLKK